VSDAGVTGCYPTGSGDGLCYSPGDAGMGEPCPFLNTCAPGLYCISQTAQDGAASQICAALCGGDAAVPCPAGQTCYDFSSSLPQSTLGFCSP
jgi:hypothetical protein